VGPGPVWTGAENLDLSEIRYPHRPARSESPYRLQGVAIKKPDCFYYSFPATSMTKRRVGH